MAEYIHVPSGTKVSFDGVLSGPMYRPADKPKQDEKPKKSKKVADGAAG